MTAVVCLLVGVAATVEDLWRRRISNVTVVAGLAAGLLAQLFSLGPWRGLGIWAAGATVGFAVFLVFFLAGGMGGGDIKLMAAFGGFLGPGRALEAALLAAIAGGLLACGHLLWRRLRSGPRWAAPGPASESIPYAPALFAGTLLSLVGT